MGSDRGDTRAPSGNQVRYCASCVCMPALQLGLVVLNGFNLLLKTDTFVKEIRHDDTVYYNSVK